MSSMRVVCLLLLAVLCKSSAGLVSARVADSKEVRISGSRRLGGEQDDDVCLADKKGDGKFKNECGFPFEYKGETYEDRCTDADNDGNLWCFLDNGKDWGLCSDSPACTGTKNPTPVPSAEPTASPTTAEPTVSPTAEPTAPTTDVPTPEVVTTPSPTVEATAEETPGSLVALQLTPVILSLLIENSSSRRILQDTPSRADALFALVNDHLLLDYDTSLEEPVAALQLLVLGQGEEQLNDTALLLTEKVLGSVYFYEQVPTQEELDGATQAALDSPDFLAKVQNASDPVLANTKEVTVSMDEQDSPLNPPTNVDTDETSSGDDDVIFGLSTTAVIALSITIFCGLCAVLLLGFVICRLRKQQRQLSAIKEASSTTDKADEQHPPAITPKTTRSDDGEHTFDNRMVEVEEGHVSDLESVQSTYSYLPDDNNSLIGAASLANYSYAATEAEEASPPRTKEPKKKMEENKQPASLLSAAKIESELDDILDAEGNTYADQPKDGSSSARDGLPPFSPLSPPPTTPRQMTLSERRRRKDDRDWTEKYGIPSVKE